MYAHHYTNNSVDTAAAAVNAGTCLEDANYEKNIFSYIGQAVNEVISTIVYQTEYRYISVIRYKPISDMINLEPLYTVESH